MPAQDLAELRHTHLVEPDWLALRHAVGPSLIRIVDLRGYVRTQTDAEGAQSATYAGAPEEYAAGHIPDSVYLDWTRDIIDENDPVPAQIAPAEKFARVLGEAGIGDAHEVIAYDSHPTSQFATRFWWAMRYYGHTNVRVLNGGWARWIREALPITADLPRFPPAIFTPRPQPEWRATAEQVLDGLGRPDVTLIDARDEGQYTGRIRRGLRGGHIPGALHLPREAFLTDEGTFRNSEEIQDLVAKSGTQPESHVVAYCNGGVAATSILFALSMLGFPHLTNYDGSWNEWSQRADLPIE